MHLSSQAPYTQFKDSNNETNNPILTVVHHFLPLMTQPLGVLSAVAASWVGSEELTSGSVIPKQDRASPVRSGRRYRCCCSRLP